MSRLELAPEPSGQEVTSRAAERIARRRGPLAGLYSGNARSIVARGLLATRSTRWAIVVAGFLEPVLYLLSLGVGLGALVGTVIGPGGQEMSYAAFIAPALLATSAMNGAVYDSTWNVFFRMRISKLYRGILNTSLGPLDVALGDIFLALLRGTIYASGFTAVMAMLGLITSPWAVMMIPASALIAFGFASFGMALTSFIKSFQGLEWISFITLLLFLFSGTFFPLSVYPEPVQWIIQALPLWQGVELLRQLGAGAIGWGLLVHIGYYLVMIVAGLILTTARLRKLFLS
ncbi:ABC transporter permease [Acaricomes phytoseiuli]|uniref:ABC transporter permease n=1 Tax=Acaricomes phytoseiuli TaxID=291968 RepID=UPI00037DDCA2|nr:ABC transporter permease [Acaricomes phytoseiuli]